MKNNLAIRDVTAERQRQQSVEGYSTQQDDTYIGGELAAAAISYIEPMEAASYWPGDWHDDSFKPSDYRRNLVKAAALIVAEIERLDRAVAPSGQPVSEANLHKESTLHNDWRPDICPITRRPFFMWIDHPELGYVPTYGGPFDSYTIPTQDNDGEFSCEHFDHDRGAWVCAENPGLYLVDDDELCRVYELKQRIVELESEIES